MKNLVHHLMKIVKWLLIAVVAGLLLCAAANFAITAFEKHNNPPIGKMIDLNEGQLHVYTAGKGTTTIVLLPGLGTPSPVYDFMPLVKVLEKKYKVCVVEPFGYGWSSQTSTPRTNQKIVEQTREALKKANVKPPYILVPHSISGLYALYYANKYPEEIKGIVGLDTSYPGRVLVDKTLKSKSINLYGLERIMGLIRVATALDPSLVEHDFKEYTESDKKILGMFTCWNVGNQTVINEKTARFDNYTETLHMKIPVTIPARMILSKENIEWFISDTPSVDWVEEHKKLVEGNQNSRIEILEGDHYIYHGNPDRVAEIISEIAN